MGINKRWMQALCGGLVLCVTFSACGLLGRCEGVRENVLRLHVLAHSDSPADQQLKLQVRDAVVEAAAGWLDEAENAQQAAEMAAKRLPQLQQIASAAVKDAGYEYVVDATLCRMYFPTRRYGEVTLPAGRYEAVRFTIGEGKGKNWWCVVYPPLCAGAATDRHTMADVLTHGQQQLVEGGRRYVIRFKVVEWLERAVWLFRGGK